MSPRIAAGSSRPCGRPGRHLCEVPTRAFLFNLPDWLMELTRQGWSLMPTTRPYLARNGTVTTRLVLRRRGTADTLVLNWTLRGTIGDELLDVLAAAMGPTRVAQARDGRA